MKLLVNSNSVADLGCGLGYNSVIFQKINPKIRYTGIDISNIAIHKAKNNYNNGNTKFLIKDLEKDNLPKENFDLIYSSQLIEHFKDDEKFLLKIYQSLKTNGNVLISTVYKKKNVIYFYKNIRGEIALAPDHINEYSNINNLFEKLENCHFKITDFDLKIFRYPLIDFCLKYLMKHVKNKYVTNFVNSSFIMFIRYYISIPILGFYNFQIIAKKVK